MQSRKWCGRSELGFWLPPSVLAYTFCYPTCWSQRRTPRAERSRLGASAGHTWLSVSWSLSLTHNPLYPSAPQPHGNIYPSPNPKLFCPDLFCPLSIHTVQLRDLLPDKGFLTWSPSRFSPPHSGPDPSRSLLTG